MGMYGRHWIPNTKIWKEKLPEELCERMATSPWTLNLQFVGHFVQCSIANHYQGI